MTRILVVEDEAHLAQGIRFNLEAEGYSADVAADGKEGLQRLAGTDYGLIILDVMLPGMDGFEVAQHVRAEKNRVPILMLTAKSQPADIVRGLEAGADDYLAKPFDLDVLLARVRGLMRRSDWNREGASASVLRVGRAEVDFDAFELRVDGNRLGLTVLEAGLLRLLADRAGSVVSKGDILEKVWKVDRTTETRAIDNFIARLRRYIEPEPASPRFLLTVRGAGYKLVPEGT